MKLKLAATTLGIAAATALVAVPAQAQTVNTTDLAPMSQNVSGPYATPDDCQAQADSLNSTQGSGYYCEFENHGFMTGWYVVHD